MTEPELLEKHPTKRLYAIGDLHLSYKLNREELTDLTPHPDDGLILCGDVGESIEHLTLGFETATSRFKHVFWVPGNHELYSLHSKEGQARGEAKYNECVALARNFGIYTPEDEFMTWDGEGGPCIIALLFTLYDYSFRPEHVSREEALDWAMEEGIKATDEAVLFPDPYASRDEWCTALVARSEKRLHDAAAQGLPLVLVNHWPLRQDLVFTPSVPRFSLWCGTKRTKDWHTQYKAKVVVTGHLHVRRTDWIDGVRFEECSLGYPRQWKEAREGGADINEMLREILPGNPAEPVGGLVDGLGKTIWRMYR